MNSEAGRISSGHYIFLNSTSGLKPVLPSWNWKYVRPVKQNVARDTGNHKIRPFAHFPNLLDSSETESEWERLLHPEGNCYWYHSGRHIVTPNNPNQSQILLETLLSTHSTMTRLTHGSRQLDANVEVFINIEGDPAIAPIAAVEYYFVDHKARQVFWPEEVDVASLGLEPFDSQDFLRSALVPEYWTHVEYFPVHRPCDLGAESELMNVLRHASIDDLTAPGSISPYGAIQCLEYLKIFEGFRSSNQAARNGYRMASLARLWASIARIRHIHSYGLSDPRLDRLHGLAEFVKSQTKSSWALSFWEALCFYIPPRTFRRLSELWNGRVVYERHWRAFFDDLRSGWFAMGVLGLALLIAGTTVLVLDGTNIAVIASTSFSMASVLVSLLLVQGHSKHKLFTAPQISSYIVSVEDFHHGLRPLSVIFSLPQALTMYSAVLLQIGLFYRSVGNGFAPGDLSVEWALALSILPILVPVILALYYGGAGVL